jgi:CRISPR/Cas system-associated exonuclease Cas4 (RecB family)
MAWVDYKRERSQPYKPGQKQLFKVSRSKIEDFVRCERCFWLDRRLKITRPDTPPFQINKAVDELFKKEFDTYRAKGEPHPLMIEYNISAIPYANDNLNTWRTNFTGVQYLHEPTNLLIFGAVDDVWVNDKDELIVVDYKATSKKSEVSLDAPWQISYKRQMEVYQWLLRKNGFNVSDTGYFVYTNGRLDLDGFFDKVEFTTKVIGYTGNDDWIEPTILKIKECLERKDMPANNPDCEYCAYARKRTELTIAALNTRKKKVKKS